MRTAREGRDKRRIDVYLNVIRNVVFLAGLSWVALVLVSPAAEPKTRPGRQVKVATIPIGFGGDHDQKLKLAIEHLEVAGASGVDIACLPEEFAGTTAEPIPGPTTTAVGELAGKHQICHDPQLLCGGRR